MSRIKITDRDTDRLKKAFEGLIVAYGGDFDDRHSGRGLKSVYKLPGGKSFQQTWHHTPSDVRGVKNLRARLRRHLSAVGVKDYARMSFSSKTGVLPKQTPEQSLAWQEYREVFKNLINNLSDDE